MRQVIAGNWKMNGGRALAGELAAALRQAPAGVDWLVCPPFPWVALMAEALAGSAVRVGGQDCSPHAHGAYTGDVSAAMLAEAGAQAVILGHSERRAHHHESDALVRAKAAAAARAGLAPIVCVGETEAERDAGDAVGRCCAQVAASLPDGFAGMVAYEPVWAIGSGRTPSIGQVAEMHAAIRAALTARLGEAGLAVLILYGGSVKPSNAASLLAVPEVGGALVGGASLEAEAFLAIGRAAPGQPAPAAR